MSDFNGRTNRPFLHIDDDLDFDLNEIVTPESKTAEMTRKRKNINLGDPIPRKSIVAKGPLDEAQERQRSFLNNMKQPQPFLRPTTSRGRMHEKSNNIFPAFRAQCTNHLKVRSTPANRGDENDDHAQDLVAFTVKQRPEGHFVDLHQHEDTHSRDSPIITERISSEKSNNIFPAFRAHCTNHLKVLSTPANRGDENDDHAQDLVAFTVKQRPEGHFVDLYQHEDTHSRDSPIIAERISSVLENISHEPYISKPSATANRSLLHTSHAISCPPIPLPPPEDTTKEQQQQKQLTSQLASSALEDLKKDYQDLKNVNDFLTAENAAYRESVKQLEFEQVTLATENAILRNKLLQAMDVNDGIVNDVNVNNYFNQVDGGDDDRDDGDDDSLLPKNSTIIPPNPALHRNDEFQKQGTSATTGKGIQQQQQQPRKLVVAIEAGIQEKCKQDYSWNKMLEAFLKHGRTMEVVEEEHGNSRLCHWIRNQRKSYWMALAGIDTGRVMSDQKLGKLDEIGFDWGKDHVTWFDTYCKISDILQKEGNLLGIEDHPELGPWLAEQMSELETTRQRNLKNMNLRMGCGWIAEYRSALLRQIGIVPADKPKA